MRMQDLELFVAVIEEGNFTAAARKIGMTQPGVSGRIAYLEQELATSLVIREARQVVPTATGKVLYAEAKKMVASFEQIRQKIQEVSTQPVGPLEISAGETSGVYLVPILLSHFKRDFPLVTPQLNIQLMAKTVADTLERKCHVGVVFFEPTDPRLEALPLCDDELVLIVPSAHPLADRAEVDPDELLPYPLLTRPREARANATLETAFEPLGIAFRDFEVVMELDSNEALKTGVSAGLGMAFVSKMSLRGERSPRYRVVSVRGLDTVRTHHLIRRRSGGYGYVERLFWDYCQSSPRLEEVRRMAFSSPAPAGTGDDRRAAQVR